MAVSPNLSRKTLVLARREATGDTATTLGSTGTNSSAMLLWDEVNPIQIDTTILDQQVVRASFSKYPDLVGRSLYMFRPKTMLMTTPGGAHSHADFGETAGTGDNCGLAAGAGKPPFFGPLLRACAVSETVTSSSTVVYAPVSSNFSAATVVVWADGLRHFAKGVVGTAVFEGRAGEGIDISFDMKGTYDEPVGGTIPTSVTYPLDGKALVEKESLQISTGYVAPVAHGVQDPVTGPIVRSFRFDMGVNIIERRDMNSPFGLFGLLPTDRKPTLDLVIEVENNLAGAGNTSPYFNPWSILTSGSSALQTVTFTHGAVTAKKSEFTFSSCQLREVQYADDQGVRTYNLSFNIVSTQDDNDWRLKIF